ncbi:MAG: hypothetical protein CM15mV47_750 [uncultured marine virus]|nr:MAG: hypothetical protein CM15mV47_750 [uncultured marine virus]
MAKRRGHRAQKANDSFGTVNNENLYRGKSRGDEVYQEETKNKLNPKRLPPADQQEAATSKKKNGR